MVYLKITGHFPWGKPRETPVRTVLYTSRGSNHLPAECMSETLPSEPTFSVVFGKVPHQNFTLFSNLLHSSHMQACQAFQYLTLLTKGVESRGDEK